MIGMEVKMGLYIISPEELRLLADELESQLKCFEETGELEPVHMNKAQKTTVLVHPQIPSQHMNVSLRLGIKEFANVSSGAFDYQEVYRQDAAGELKGGMKMRVRRR